MADDSQYYDVTPDNYVPTVQRLLAENARLRAREAAAMAIVRAVATKGVTIYSSEGKPEAYIAPETVDAARALLEHK